MRVIAQVDVIEFDEPLNGCSPALANDRAALLNASR